MRGINKVLCGAALAVLGYGAFFPVSSSAAINQQISFQGKLTNPDGTNVINGSYSVRFRIYTDPALDAANSCLPGSNSCKWEDTENITVADGIFSYALGSDGASPLPGSVDFNTATLYLGVKVGTDAEMTPRIQLTAAPYAFNSDKLNGISSAGFVQLGQNASAQTDNSNNSAIYINKTATGNQLQLQSAGVDVFTVSNSGDITFGQNSAHTIGIAQESTNAAGNNLTVTAGQGGAGASANAGGQLTLQGGAGGGTNGVGGNILLAGGAGSGSGLSGGVVVRNPANSTTAFVVQNAASEGVFMVDTLNQQVEVVAVAAPTNDLVSITNAGQAVTTAGVSALGVNYVGGNAAIEASGVRIDYTPGGTSGGTWSGLRIVSNATGPVSGVTAYGIKLEGPSSPGAGTEVGIRVASGFDIGIDVASGGLQLSDMDDPVTPAANTLRIFAQTRAGRTLPKIKGPTGLSTALQPALFANKVGWYSAQGNSTTISVLGMAATTNGTATARNVATTGLFASVRRLGYVSAAGAGSSAGVRTGAGQFWFGNGANLGGFYFVSRFGVSQTQANMRSFIAMSATTGAFGNANPSTFVNMFGFGCDTGETNFSFMHNDGAGAATKDSLVGTGLSFPCNTANTDFYETRMFVVPNTTTVYYSIERLNTGELFEGSTATNLPANTTLLAPQLWVNNGTTAAAVAIDVSAMYLETDN